MKSKTFPKPRGQGMALLVIDVQVGLFKKRLPIHHAAEILANINSLIERARLTGVPVIYVQHCNESFLEKDTPDWQLHPELVPPNVDDLRIYKCHGSAFQDTPLEQELEVRGAGRLVICGLVTNGCVRAACQDALAMGFLVTLAADGHSSFSKDAAKLIDELNDKLQQAGAQIVLAADIDFLPETAVA